MKKWLIKNKKAVLLILSGLAAIGITYGILTEDQTQQLIKLVESFL